MSSFVRIRYFTERNEHVLSSLTSRSRAGALCLQASMARPTYATHLETIVVHKEPGICSPDSVKYVNSALSDSEIVANSPKSARTMSIMLCWIVFWCEIEQSKSRSTASLWLHESVAAGSTLRNPGGNVRMCEKITSGSTVPESTMVWNKRAPDGRLVEL